MSHPKNSKGSFHNRLYNFILVKFRCHLVASLYLIAPSTRHKERTPNRDIRRHASAAGVPYLTANCSSNWAFYPSKMWNRWVASQHKENLGNRDRRRKEPWHKPQYTIYIEFGFSPERRHSSGSSRCSLQCGAERLTANALWWQSENYHWPCCFFYQTEFCRDSFY